MYVFGIHDEKIRWPRILCMFIHGRPSGSNGTTDIYNQTTCIRMLHKIVSLLENSQHSQHSRPWRFVDQCLLASQITCRLGVPSAPVSGQHEQAYSPYRRTQNERHSSVQIKRWIDKTRWLGPRHITRKQQCLAWVRMSAPEYHTSTLTHAQILDKFHSVLVELEYILFVL